MEAFTKIIISSTVISTVVFFLAGVGTTGFGIAWFDTFFPAKKRFVWTAAGVFIGLIAVLAAA